MASLSFKDNVGTIQFVDPHTRRRLTIRTGKVSRKAAELFRAHVDYLVNAKAARQAPPQDTARWVGALGDAVHARLAKAGLVDPREGTAAAARLELDAMISAYIDRRTDLKPRTLKTWRQFRVAAVGHFGKGTDPRTVNRATAADFRRAMLERFAAATVALYVRQAKQVYRDAVDRKLLADNPFAVIKPGSMVNADRNVFVPQEDVRRVIDSIADPDYRVALALARFGGLRTPSETRLLKWSDVDWARGRMVVTSPKTEHHAGRAKRVVPIFPELLPYLRAAFEAADEGAVHVVARRRGDMASTVMRYAERAGFAPCWPRVFQNLRASRETELTMRFPMHVVCKWIGHTPRVAEQHYLMVTDDHFEKALQPALRSGADMGGHGERAAQNTPEKPAVRDSVDSRMEPVDPLKGLEITQASHRALQKALHGYIGAMRDASKRLMRKGRRARSARRTGRGAGR